MNFKQYNKAVNRIPRHRAVFVLVRVPEWMDEFNGQVGQLFHVYDRDPETLIRVDDGFRCAIGPSYLEFSNYELTTPH